jgi:hypothetical protein
VPDAKTQSYSESPRDKSVTPGDRIQEKAREECLFENRGHKIHDGSIHKVSPCRTVRHRLPLLAEQRGQKGRALGGRGIGSCVGNGLQLDQRTAEVEYEHRQKNKQESAKAPPPCRARHPDSVCVLADENPGTTKAENHLHDKPSDNPSRPVLCLERVARRPQPQRTRSQGGQPLDRYQAGQQHSKPWLRCANLLDNGWMANAAHVMPNDQRQRRKPAATDARIVSELKGWLPSAGRSG